MEAPGGGGGDRRSVLMMKTGRSPHALRHVWFNAHDPGFLRYAPEADFRGVKVVPLSPATVTLEWKKNRTGCLLYTSDAADD